MPQKLEDGVFKKFIYVIANHKTVESIQLMNFLMKRKTPKNIDLTYEGYAPNSNKDSYNARDSLVASKMRSELKKIFVLHGALDLDIPIMAPMQESVTVFLSARQQAPDLVERRESMNSDGA